MRHGHEQHRDVLARIGPGGVRGAAIDRALRLTIDGDADEISRFFHRLFTHEREQDVTQQDAAAISPHMKHAAKEPPRTANEPIEPVVQSVPPRYITLTTDPKPEPVYPPGIRRLLDQWEAEAKRQSSAGYVVQIRRLLIDLHKHAGIDDWARLDRTHVAAFVDHMAKHGRVTQEGRVPRPPSGKSVNNALAAIRSFLDWAVRAEALPKNVAKGVGWSKHCAGTRRAFTAAEVQALIEGAKARGSPDRALLYRFLAVTGLRIGTAERLRWQHLDLYGSPPSIRIPGAILKMGRNHVVTLPDDDARALVERLQAMRPAQQDFVFGPRPHIVRLKLDAKRGGVQFKDTLGRGAGWHCFRRFVATQLAAAKVSPKIAQARLGHKDIATTLRNYTDEHTLGQDDAARTLSDTLRVLPRSTESYPQGTGNSTQAVRNDDDAGVQAMLNTTPQLDESRSGHPRSLGNAGLNTTGARVVVRPSEAPRPLGSDAASRDEWAQQDSNLLPSRKGNRICPASDARLALRIAARALRIIERTTPGREAGGGKAPHARTA